MYILVGDADNEGGCACAEAQSTRAQFCCESKTVLQNKASLNQCSLKPLLFTVCLNPAICTYYGFKEDDHHELR